jgi:hypothetical protein
MEQESRKPSLDEIMQSIDPDWGQLPIEKQTELLGEWLQEVLASEEGAPLRAALELDDDPDEPA